MKKLLLVATLCVAGLVSANNKVEASKEQPKKQKNKSKSEKVSNNRTVCLAVETSCGETVYACGEANSDGGLDWEEIDDMRQLGEAAFCS